MAYLNINLVTLTLRYYNFIIQIVYDLLIQTKKATGQALLKLNTRWMLRASSCGEPDYHRI